MDDVFSTGVSLQKIIDNIYLESRVAVAQCCVVVKRGENPNFEYPLSYLFKAEEFF